MDKADLNDLLDSEFSTLVPLVNRFIISHMQRLVTELGMDLEMTMLLGIISHFNTAHLSTVGSNSRLLKSVERDIDTSKFPPMKLAQLARVSGLPRETVRRKAEQLVKLNRLTSHTDGGWIIKLEGIDELTRTFAKQTVKNFIDVSLLMQQVINARRG